MAMTETDEIPSGIIMIAHEVLAEISQHEMLQALPQALTGLPREIVHLTSVKASLADLGSFDWFTARQKQLEEITQKLQPLLEKHPDWPVQYFGAAPIPLAMALGFQLGGFKKIQIYQQLHSPHTGWKWPQTGTSAAGALVPLTLSNEAINAKGNVVLRISLSHKVDLNDVIPVVRENIGEYEISLVTPHVDGLQSPADLSEAAEEFKRFIDWAHRYRPNARIHVFAAVTVGAALQFGVTVNPTVHSPVHCYQYFGAKELRYQHTFELQGATQQRRITLTDEDKIAMSQFRQQASDELAKIQLASTLLHNRDKTKVSGTWFENLFPDQNHEVFSEGFLSIGKLYQTPIADSRIDLTPSPEPADFYDPAAKRWLLDDSLLFSISQRISDANDRRLAIRLLLLHEGIHAVEQRLTSAVATQIRRFPKILEQLDYQADAWAYLHEIAIGRLQTGDLAEHAREDLLKVFEAAISTFWAFDALADPSHMEIRRINRYLIWYWQRLRVEQCRDLKSILKVMGDMPAIEIAGPEIKIIGGRVSYFLDEVYFDEPELALISNGRLYRAGHSAGSPVKDILAGFRDRDDSKILHALRGFFDQVS